ncbi:MAG: hypothetical protein CSA38_05310 [Flavobacteriales bacterium]|nr:MAG: hypothetical protein CSA38_05310 [Flavobacteriales bacterium]
MKQIFSLIAVCCSMFVFSQKKLDNSLLWKVEGKNLSQPSYLYGTIHMICNNDFRFSDVLKKTISEVDKIGFEANMGDINQLMEMQQNMAKIEKPLTEFLNDEDEKILNNYLQKKLHVGLQNFDRMKPVALMMTLTILHFPCEMTAMKSYEKEIGGFAKDQQKKMFYLETLGEQWKILDALPDQKEAEEIVEMVKKDKEYDEMSLKMIASYKKQNINEIHDLMEQQMDAEKTDRMLNNRNKNWIPKIENEIKDNSCLIAVGAGHLVGKEGLIQLLRAKGYKVTAVQQ